MFAIFVDYSREKNMVDVIVLGSTVGVTGCNSNNFE